MVDNIASCRPDSYILLQKLLAVLVLACFVAGLVLHFKHWPHHWFADEGSSDNNNNNNSSNSNGNGVGDNDVHQSSSSSSSLSAALTGSLGTYQTKYQELEMSEHDS